MNTVIIESVVSVAANLAITLIGVLGAWLLTQIGRNQRLRSINIAVGELTSAVETTVMELQQTIVDGLKESSADGKLTRDDISTLGEMLYEGTMQKMSASVIDVLEAAEVDINAVIKGAGEALISKMKSDYI